MTKNKNKKTVESVLLEDVSPKFQENQAVIDACASDKNVMKDYVLNHSDIFLDAIDNFYDSLREAKNKYKEKTGKRFPLEKEEEYKNNYFEVHKRLNEFHGGSA